MIKKESKQYSFSAVTDNIMVVLAHKSATYHREKSRTTLSSNIALRRSNIWSPQRLVSPKSVNAFSHKACPTERKGRIALPTACNKR